MGQLIDGTWQDDKQISSGESFERKASEFRHWLSAPNDPAGNEVPAASLDADVQIFAAAKNRYHLYVAWACPWAHRTLIFRKLKGLESLISVSIAQPHMGDSGWVFDQSSGEVGHTASNHNDLPDTDSTPDTINHKNALYEIYQLSDPEFTGRVTVPVLWDTKHGQIVNNESADIIRMFNFAFDDLGAQPGDFYPSEKREEIDSLNERIYSTVNNGVYKAGFAKSQSAYDSAVEELFDTLSWLETRLARQRFLLGDETTEADWRLLPTLLRFDAIYALHFKCSKRRIIDFPNLWAYTRDLYQHPGIADTFRLAPTMQHYYTSHPEINPTGIVASAPALQLDASHRRKAMTADPDSQLTEDAGVIAPRPVQANRGILC
ncbi:MAG: glutathione S-transferase family protein [Pseudomonadaceae bacterium]|nr:glutathione S-transferase family protein [Pseudomonadaceae bacterium]